MAVASSFRAPRFAPFPWS